MTVIHKAREEMFINYSLIFSRKKEESFNISKMPAVIKLFLICLISMSLNSCSKNDPEIIGLITEFTITSSIINDDYPISVFQSPHYTGNPNNELIIVLDGELHFIEIAGILSEKSVNGSIAPCLVVGIGNLKERNRDYTPTKYEHGEGGAENFYHFLNDELIPELKSRYNIQSSNEATLIGYSFGGLFTHYAMFQKRIDNPFNKFIVGGCSFWYDSGVIFEYEESYASENSDLDVKFYSGMGTLEGGVSIASFAEMTKSLKSRDYPSLLMKTEMIKKHGHSGASNVSFKNGLDYVFQN